MLTEGHFKKIREYASNYTEIAAVYLFGSFAFGKPKDRSDVDIGILFYSKIDGLKKVEVETELSNLINRDVDLIDMKKASPLLRHQIYKDGKRIYMREIDYPAIFRASSIREYLDTLYLYEKRMELMYGK